MKAKITLKKVSHYEEWRYAVYFSYNDDLTSIVRRIDGARWSKTLKCWHVPCDEEHLKKILSSFRDKADIDISSIVSKEREEINLETTDANIEKEDIHSDSDIDPYDYVPVSVAPSFERNVPEQFEFDPVMFTISETDGSLVIKFTGRYDRDWIKELKTFGNPQFDGVRKEWHLWWSQIAVDSLSDYFAGRGVKIIIRKKEVPKELKETRKELGKEIRERFIGKPSLDGLDLVRRHLEMKRYSKRTIESYLGCLELFFKYFNESDPKDIEEEDIIEFIEKYILESGYSASYQNILISAIKIFYQLSESRKVDMESLKRPKRSRALPKVFSKEEIMKIFSATRNNKHKLILWMIYSCGLRRSEVINIKLTDLSTERGVLHIREGKGNVDRLVPIPEKVWKKISTYIKEYGPREYLFEGQTGGKYSAESVYSVFKQSLRKAGIMKDVGVHSLRHSYATHLHEGGLDIRYIQELLGHKSSKTTEIYTHVSRRNLFKVRSPIEDIDID